MSTNCNDCHSSRLPKSGCGSYTTCPTCGSLTSLCRPRFFAGQLLTEDTLNQLDRYITGKNKLHNRYLHGKGVVCGLEVACHPCDGYVTVKAGYALSPCGDDIVLSHDFAVPICEMINKCREKKRRPSDCEPYRSNTNTADCADIVEKWVLSICYDESHSHGVTALRGSSAAGNVYDSSAGNRCGCNSASQGTTQTSYRAAYKNAPVQCEATLICEGYRFQVRPLTTATAERKQPPLGEAAERITNCTTEFIGIIKALSDKATFHDICCSLKAALGEMLAHHNPSNCQLDERLDKIRCPVPPPGKLPINQKEEGNSAFTEESRQTLQELLSIAIELLKSCLCSALLPPCPGPEQDDCIPLATISIGKSNCEILQVCNVSPRELVVTIPNIRYWLSVLPIEQGIAKVVANLCCEKTANKFVQQVVNQLIQRSVAKKRKNTREQPVAPGASLSSWTEIMKMAEARKANPVNFESLLLDQLGFDLYGKKPLHPLERSNILETLLANQVIVPLMSHLLPAEPALSKMASDTDLADLHGKVEALTKMVKAQQTVIKNMQKTIKEPR